MGRLESNKKSMVFAVPLTVIAIVFSQFFYYQGIDYSMRAKQENATQQQQDDQSDQQVFVSIPSTSLPSSTHVVLNQVLFLLFEIHLEVTQSTPKHFRILLPPNRFFKTLFHDVISPNAP